MHICIDFQIYLRGCKKRKRKKKHHRGRNKNKKRRKNIVDIGEEEMENNKMDSITMIRAQLKRINNEIRENESDNGLENGEIFDDMQYESTEFGSIANEEEGLIHSSDDDNGVFDITKILQTTHESDTEFESEESDNERIMIDGHFVSVGNTPFVHLNIDMIEEGEIVDSEQNNIVQSENEEKLQIFQGNTDVISHEDINVSESEAEEDIYLKNITNMDSNEFIAQLAQDAFVKQVCFIL